MSGWEDSYEAIAYVRRFVINNRMYINNTIFIFRSNSNISIHCIYIFVIFSAMVSCILQEKYSLNIELDTLLTITSGIAVFSLGEWISENYKHQGKSILRNSNWSLKSPFLIKLWMILLMTGVGAIFLYMRYLRGDG